MHKLLHKNDDDVSCKNSKVSVIIQENLLSILSYTEFLAYELITIKIPVTLSKLLEFSSEAWNSNADNNKIK